MKLRMYGYDGRCNKVLRWTFNDLIGFGCGRAAENLLHWLADCATHNATSNSTTPLSISYSIHGVCSYERHHYCETIACVYTRAASSATRCL